MTNQVYLALETLFAINDAIKVDQGAEFRKLEGVCLPQLKDAYDDGPPEHRSHMGASLIGNDCARQIWYGFHWLTKRDYDGTLLRLFNRGHLEEGRFTAMLLLIGCEIFQLDENGKQFRISVADGHAGGSGDGVAIGVPDLPDPQEPCLTEYKTHGKKSFNELAGENWKEYREDQALPIGERRNIVFEGLGVKAAKFTHYVQVQVYMRKMELTSCLYLAVNKDNDEIYAEIIPLDIIVADQYIDRMERLVALSEPPKRISNDPSVFNCRYCDHRDTCHKLGTVPDQNCRTCVYSRIDGPDWLCTWRGKFIKIDKARQLIGCTEYQVNPSL